MQSSFSSAHGSAVLLITPSCTCRSTRSKGISERGERSVWMALAPACAAVGLSSLESCLCGLHTDYPPGAEVLQRSPLVRPILKHKQTHAVPCDRDLRALWFQVEEKQAAAIFLQILWGCRHHAVCDPCCIILYSWLSLLGAPVCNDHGASAPTVHSDWFQNFHMSSTDTRLESDAVVRGWGDLCEDLCLKCMRRLRWSCQRR